MRRLNVAQLTVEINLGNIAIHPEFIFGFRYSPKAEQK